MNSYDSESSQDKISALDSLLWDKYKEGSELLEEEQFEEAFLLFQALLLECESKESDDGLLLFGILRGLSVSCAGLGEIDQLEPLLRRWIATGEIQFGKWHPENAYPYSMLGLVREEQGNLAEAESMHKRAVEILVKTKNEDSIDMANALDEMSGFFLRRRDFAQAGKLLRQSLQIEDKIPEYTEADKIERLLKLVDIALLSHHFDDVEPVCRRVFSYLQEYDPSYSWYPLSSLACCFVAQGKQAEAEVAFERVVELIQQSGVEHNEGFRRVFEAYAAVLTKANLAEKAKVVHALARRIIYESFEVKSEEGQIQAKGLPFTMLADVLYRLESPDLVLDLDDETELEYRIQIKEIVVSALIKYFDDQDFLQIYLSLSDVENQVKARLDEAFAKKGFGVIFRFREFSDRIGFLEVIGKLQGAESEAEGGKSKKAESLFEEALVEAAQFPSSGLWNYVRNLYLDYFENTGQEMEAEILRNREP